MVAVSLKKKKNFFFFFFFFSFFFFFFIFFFFQAEDGIRDLVRSRGLGDVYKRQGGESIHLETYPVADESFIDEKLEEKMRIVRTLVTLSLIHI